MSSDLILYTNPMSRGRLARWILEEVGAPYETVLLDYGTSMKAPDYLKINPMGKVPALVHKGAVITETAAIFTYLADAFPAAGLAPALNDPQRGPYLRWMFFGAACLDPAMSNQALGVQVPADKTRMVGYGSMADVLNTLSETLTRQPYLCGDTPTAADIFVGAQLGWMMQFKMVEPRPEFERLVGALFARPAAQRARALDDALMPKE